MRAGRFKWVEPDQVGTAPSMVQGHPMSKTKFSLSKTGCNWVAVPTGSISKNQSVSRQKMENAVSASKDASFGMSNSKISLLFIYMHSKMDVTKKLKRLIIWNGGSRTLATLVLVDSCCPIV